MKAQPFTIESINISLKKGVKKSPIETGELVENHGLKNDAHSGPWHRQLSLLAAEPIDDLKAQGWDLHYGDFAENITTRGVELHKLPVGTRLHLGDAILEVTQIGKECHMGCEIRAQIGDCIMPRMGIFARVLTGGEIDGESRCYYSI